MKHWRMMVVILLFNQKCNIGQKKAINTSVLTEKIKQIFGKQWLQTNGIKSFPILLLCVLFPFYTEKLQIPSGYF